MAKVHPIKNNFSGGEISPLAQARVELDAVKNGCATVTNWLLTPQGAAVRRPGTVYTNSLVLSDLADKYHSVGFEFSSTVGFVVTFYQNYLGTKYIYVHSSDGTLLSTITGPYFPSYPSTQEMQHAQFGDRIIFAHIGMAPKMLTRYSNTVWNWEDVPLKNGPYLPVNSTGATIACPGGTTLDAGPVTNVSGVVKITGNYLRFTVVSTSGYSVGMRIHVTGILGATQANGTWTVKAITATTIDTQQTVGTLTAYSSAGSVAPAIFEGCQSSQLFRTNVSGNWVEQTLFSIASDRQANVVSSASFTATTTWRMGLYNSGNYGYPGAVCFHENRLVFGGSPSSAQRIDGSVTGDYFNFQPTAAAGTVTADNAYAFPLLSGLNNTVVWCISDYRGLKVGTSGDEWIVKPSSQGEALTPLNVNATKSTTYGSGSVNPIQIGTSVLFTDPTRTRLFELRYIYEIDGFVADEISLLAEHLSGKKIKSMCYQKKPYPTVWVLTDTNELLSFMYHRSSDSFSVGWSKHLIGGTRKNANDSVTVEGLCCIPSSDNISDRVFLLVKRYIEGSVAADSVYLEYVSSPYYTGDSNASKTYADASLSYTQSSSNIGVYAGIESGLLEGTGTLFGTNTSGGASVGDFVLIKNSKYTALNNQVFKLEYVGSFYEFTGVYGSGIHPTTYDVLSANSGTATKLVSSISGLTHLQGLEVSIWSDIGAQTKKTVSNTGVLTLDNPATQVQIGLGYNSDIQTLRFEAGAADGTSYTKTQRINSVGISMHNTGALSVGPDFDNLSTVVFREGDDQIGLPAPLFTGVKTLQFEGNYDNDAKVAIRVSDPLPATITAIVPQMTTQDR